MKTKKNAKGSCWGLWITIMVFFISSGISVWGGCSDNDSKNGNENNNLNDNQNQNENTNQNTNNKAPVAVDDMLVLEENTQVIVDVLENDFDEDGDPLTISEISDPLRGRVDRLSGDILRYTPFPHFNGTDTFEYTIEDGNGGSDSATVTLTVSPTGEDFYVATDGDDENPGTIEEPFATLEQAQATLRGLSELPTGGVTVWLRQGVYKRTETFELINEDSGTSESPVVYSGYPGETVKLVGGSVLNGNNFSITDSSSPVWNRLHADAKGHVMEINLNDEGITDFGQLLPRGFYDGGTMAALELFFNGEPQQLARWPDPDEHEPPANAQDDSITLFGNPSPDVTGEYVATGTSDGVNSYQRQGLVGGLQYHLYRHTWDYEGNTYTAWFLTTNESGYPSDTDPWWYLYSKELGAFNPAEGAGASGSPTTLEPGLINWGFVRIEEALSDTEFTYFGDRPQRWTEAENVWFHGYWVHQWADRTMNASQINTSTKTITLNDVPGYGIRAGQPYYAFNLLEEITQPGEWYLNRDTGVLYFWPPQDPSLTETETVVSLMETPLIQLNDTTWITIQNLTLEATRATLVKVNMGSDNTLSYLLLRNAGTNAAEVSGTRNRVERCEILHSGNGGVILSGGDRSSLTPGENSVTNCHIHHFSRFSRTYQPGVRLSGVGHLVSHNRIHNAPHSAILYGGNEHEISYNDIHDVCRWTSDAGAIYAGRDWGARGNLIKFNFIHHIDSDFEGYGVHGVYIDDCLSGITVFGNILYEISGHGILHGGGRDNFMENNLMVSCGSALSSDSRGLHAIVNDGSSWDLLKKIQDMSYTQDPWASAYPSLAEMPNDWATLSDPGNTWLYPEGCTFSRNLGFRNTNFMRENLSGGTGTFDKFAEIADNIEDQDPLFVDEAGGDLNLLSSSPAFTLPGFVEIPFDEIGIQKEP